jgi:hypothetical protein
LLQEIGNLMIVVGPNSSACSYDFELFQSTFLIDPESLPGDLSPSVLSLQSTTMWLKTQ